MVSCQLAAGNGCVWMMLLWCYEQGRGDEVCVVIRTVLWCADVGAVQWEGECSALGLGLIGIKHGQAWAWASDGGRMAAVVMLCPWCADVLMLDCYCYAGGQVDGSSSAVVAAAVSVFDGGWSSRSKVVVVVVEMHGGPLRMRFASLGGGCALL